MAKTDPHDCTDFLDKLYELLDCLTENQTNANNLAYNRGLSAEDLDEAISDLRGPNKSNTKALWDAVFLNRICAVLAEFFAKAPACIQIRHRNPIGQPMRDLIEATKKQLEAIQPDSAGHKKIAKEKARAIALLEKLLTTCQLTHTD